MKCSPVAAYSRPPMCFQVENIGDRVLGGSFDVSTAVPPRLKTWSDRSGGAGAGRFTVWVHVPTSPLADACPFEAVPAGVIATPAATTIVSAAATRIATTGFRVISTPSVSCSFPKEGHGYERLPSRAKRQELERNEGSPPCQSIDDRSKAGVGEGRIAGELVEQRRSDFGGEVSPLEDDPGRRSGRKRHDDEVRGRPREHSDASSSAWRRGRNASAGHAADRAGYGHFARTEQSAK